MARKEQDMSRPRAWAKAAELKHSPPEWCLAWEPLPANDDPPDPEGDAYWLDALADANSGSEELNRRTQ
jgi:hypothetical protein